MEPKCNHTYTLRSGKIFRCDARPHINRPSEHYFVRDKKLEVAAEARRRNPLISVPGYRR